MKCGRRVSDTAGGRWRRHRKTKLDGDELSVAYAPPGVTRHKSSHMYFIQILLLVTVLFA